MHAADAASNLSLAETGSRTCVGELTALLPSWRLHLEASNVSPGLSHRWAALPAVGAAAAAFGEHAEAFIAAELKQTQSPPSAAARYRQLRQLWMRSRDHTHGQDALADRSRATGIRLSNDQIRWRLPHRAVGVGGTVVSDQDDVSANCLGGPAGGRSRAR